MQDTLLTAKIQTCNAQALQKEQNMKQKKLVSVIGALGLMLSAVLVVAGCKHSNKVEQPAEVVHVEAVGLAYTVAYPVLNVEFTIPVKIFPENATNKEVTWESTNPAFVTVDKHTGVIKCIQEGQAGLTLIIVTSKDGNKTSACYVSVPDHL